MVFVLIAHRKNMTLLNGKFINMKTNKQVREKQIRELEKEIDHISQAIDDLEKELEKKNDKLISLLRVVDYYEEQ